MYEHIHTQSKTLEESEDYIITCPGKLKSPFNLSDTFAENGGRTNNELTVIQKLQRSYSN